MHLHLESLLMIAGTTAFTLTDVPMIEKVIEAML